MHAASGTWMLVSENGEALYESLQPPTIPSTESWVAVWTRSRHEHAVCSMLASKKIVSFLPTVKRLSRWKDRNRIIAWPLFPSYCFAHVKPSDVATVLRCFGAVAILSNDGRPVEIPESEISALQRLVESGLAFDPSPLVRTGATVEVIDGPLAGVTGRLIGHGRREQLLLAVDVLNGGARVEVSASDVRLV
jgi:transcription antitermination factor NusG